MLSSPRAAHTDRRRNIQLIKAAVVQCATGVQTNGDEGLDHLVGMVGQAPEDLRQLSELDIQLEKLSSRLKPHPLHGWIGVLIESIVKMR